MSHAALAVALLADDDTDKGSPIGLFVVLVLIIAVYFLYRSMNRHMRNLPESFDPPTPPSAEAADVTEADPTAADVPAVAAPEEIDQPASAKPDLDRVELSKPD